MMNLDNYVTLGRSGLRVSPLCLGTMTFGEEWGWGASVQESERILDRYLELGGNFVDTANVYTFGHSEQIIGNCLKRDSSKRDRTVLATKFFGSRRQGDPNAGGAHRKNIIASCEESLRRLQTDYIDLYWMHCWDYETPIEETLRSLQDLVTSGKVRYIGFSDTPAWKVAEAQTITKLRGWETLAAIQIEYSLLERTVEGELLPMATDMGLGVTPWSPLKNGILTGKYRREDHGKKTCARGDWVTSALNDRTYSIVDTVVQVAKEIRSTPARVALQWLCAQPGVTSPIIGARSLQQLDDNLAALELKLSSSQLNQLSQISTPSLNFPAEFLKRSPAFRNPQVTINGEAAPESALAMREGQNKH